MLKILIVDDERPARVRLRRLLEGLPGCRVAGEAASGDEALERIRADCPDALLLDISMPGLDGMGLAKALAGHDPAPAVIFCTAWPDQALDAFDTGAVDYLLKPVSRDRLQAALDKAARYVGESGPGEFLTCIVGGHRELIDLREVACLLAEDKYTTVFHDRGKKVINDSLVDIERAHPDRFLRVHRNALVARHRIRGLDRGDGNAYRVLLEGCDFQPRVSRRQLPELRRALREMT
jgi:two-component system response regulator AlgR